MNVGRQSTLSQIDRIFDKDVLPALKALPIAEVSRLHLLGVLGRLERRRAFTVAEKCRTWFNQLFRYAMVKKGLEQNPAADLDIVAAPKPAVSHQPFLYMGDLSVLLQKINRYGGQLSTRLGIRLLLLTGVRTGELRAAVPEQFDLARGLWIIPPKLVKQLQVRLRKEGRDIPSYIVPLSQQALEIVHQLLKAKTPGQRYLLPGRNDPQKPISENTLNAALRRMGYVDKLTGHGIRATLSTALNELGYEENWVDAQLSHADPNLARRSYNHAQYIEPRRRMMQEWADCLDRWERGEPQPQLAAPQVPDSLQLIAEYLQTLAEGRALNPVAKCQAGCRQAAASGRSSLASETASRNAWRKLESVLPAIKPLERQR